MSHIAAADLSMQNHLRIFLIARTCTADDVRLVGGSDSSHGRAEICYNGIWFAVCNYDWQPNDALVLCAQLGYSCKLVLVAIG